MKNYQKKCLNSREILTKGIGRAGEKDKITYHHSQNTPPTKGCPKKPETKIEDSALTQSTKKTFSTPSPTKTQSKLSPSLMTKGINKTNPSNRADYRLLTTKVTEMAVKWPRQATALSIKTMKKI